MKKDNHNATVVFIGIDDWISDPHQFFIGMAGVQEKRLDFFHVLDAFAILIDKHLFRTFNGKVLCIVINQLMGKELIFIFEEIDMENLNKL